MLYIIENNENKICFLYFIIFQNKKHFSKNETKQVLKIRILCFIKKNKENIKNMYDSHFYIFLKNINNTENTKFR